MASNVTLQFLRDQARARADMQQSGFVEDAELDAYINGSAQELYDLLTTKFEDYYIADQQLSAVSPDFTVDVPANFYKLRGVDIKMSDGSWATAMPFTFQQRNALQNPLIFPLTEQTTIMYRLRGNKIQFLGFTGSPMTVRLWFVPTFTKLVAGTDVVDGVNGWEEYIIVDAAIKMMAKEESDPSVLLAQKAQMRERIENTAANRDAGAPERVTDTSMGPYGPFQRF